MIKLVSNPCCLSGTVESIKINENYACYSDISLFWIQENSTLVIGMLDGNMVLDGEPCDLDELKEFLGMINPVSIFANCDLLDSLGLCGNRTNAFVMSIRPIEKTSLQSDELSSNEVYDILNFGGLSMPRYEDFAVDFCHRKNLGRLKYFGIKNKACAVSIGTDNVLINGILSKEKGMGSICLKGVLSQNINKCVYAVCEEKNKAFYEKNGFVYKYKVGYLINVIL